MKNIWQQIRDLTQDIRSPEFRWTCSSLSFSTLLSLIPFLALSMAIFKSVGGLEFLYPKMEAFVLGYLKSATGTETTALIRKILERVNAKTLGVSGFLFLMITNFRLYEDMEIGINKMWKIEQYRSRHHRILRASMFVVVFPVLFAGYTGLRSLSYVQKPMGGAAVVAMDITMLVGILFLFNITFPNTRVHRGYALVCSFVSGVGIGLLVRFLAGIAGKAFQYSKIYGSLAALPLTIVAILWVWYLILGGASLTHRLQKRHLLK